MTTTDAFQTQSAVAGVVANDASATRSSRRRRGRSDADGGRGDGGGGDGGCIVLDGLGVYREGL